ncbi:MAG: FAD-dependent oxidoreductase [Deltaproteobacteria bacterium]|nr:FAD-dependent oxidoreductase [Deltaproteobacteria bacterium]
MVEARDVVIIGGGFAGLSAGVALAERGFRVALLEGKPALGGRAYSFPDTESGDLVDNGQHVLMGCYHQTLDFLAKIGARDRLIIHHKLDIEMLDGPGRPAHLRTASLPGPLHMAAGLMRYQHLTIAERLAAMRAGMRMMYMRRFARARLKRMTVAEFMDVTGQGSQARRTFWYPLAIATLNEQPHLASAALFAEVIKRAFFSRRNDSAFLYSKVGLSALYCDAAREFIEKRDGVVACRAIVDSLEMSDSVVSAVRLRGGANLQASNFIAAVPPAQLLRLLPEAMAGDGLLSQIDTLKSSPIICVHVWLDREVTPAAFVGFVGTATQWLFNKRRIFSDNGARHPGYLSFVISGARELVELPNEELLEMVMNDLSAMIPAAKAAQLIKALVLKEKHATFAPDPASDAVRPFAQTAVRNLFLAGDWIQTGLPATIESAVIAGRSAAAAVAARVANR